MSGCISVFNGRENMGAAAGAIHNFWGRKQKITWHTFVLVLMMLLCEFDKRNSIPPLELEMHVSIFQCQPLESANFRLLKSLWCNAGIQCVENGVRGQMETRKTCFLLQHRLPPTYFSDLLFYCFNTSTVSSVPTVTFKNKLFLL